MYRNMISDYIIYFFAFVGVLNQVNSYAILNTIVALLSVLILIKLLRIWLKKRQKVGMF